MAILKGGGIGGGGLSVSRLQAGLTLSDIPGTGWWSPKDKSQLIQPDIVAFGYPVRILDASAALLPTGFSDTRSTTATYYNSSGVVSTASANTLRTNYDASSTLQGDLIEPAGTNICLQSQTFNVNGTAGATVNQWTKDTTNGPTITAATGVSDPAGGTSAATIDFAGNTSATGLYQFLNTVTLTTYTFSVWMRLNSGNTRGTKIRLSTNNSLAWNTGISAEFTLTSTWQRYSVTGQVSTANTCNVSIDCRDVAGTYDSNVTGKYDIWGAQLELGSVPTSYITTTSATVTRAADAASFTLNSNATQLTFTFDDSSTQMISGLTGGTTYNIPTNLNRPNILYIDDDSGVAGTNVGAASGAGTATAEGTGIVTAVGSAAGSGTASGVVVGLSATDKYTTISVSADGLTATNPSALSGNHNVRGNTPGSAGEIFEVTCTSINNAATNTSGFGLANATQSLSVYVGDPNGIAWYASGYVEWPGSGFGNNWATYTTNDVITWELLGSTAKAYKNGVLAGTATSLPSGSLYPVVAFGSDSTDAVAVNFGSKAFSYLPAGDTGWNGLSPSAGNVGAASGSGAATAVGASTAASQGASSGSATVTAVGASTARSSGSAAGSGAATAVGASTAASVGSAAGSGAATAVGASTAQSAGTSAGSGAATATAGLVGAAAGSGTATAVGASTAASVGSSAGSGAATAIGASTAQSVGAAAGSATVTAIGVATAVGVGSAAGTETVTAVGAATDNSVGSSTGSSTGSGVGASSSTGIGDSAGSGAAIAIGAATASGVGSSAGHATAAAFTGIIAQADGAGAASGVGASTASAVGSASGTATVTAVSSSASVGSSSGTASVSGIGQAISVAIGSAAGIGSASGTASAATGSAVGSASGSGSAIGIAPAAVVSAIGTAAGSGISSAFSPSTDFSSDFGGDFAHQPVSTELDFGGDFSDDFAVLQGTIFSRDFSDDFNDDFAVLHAISHDFNSDFNDDFAVYHVTTVVSAVGQAAGASIVSGHLSTDVETPPVYPVPPPPVPIVWHPANEYRRVQAPRAIRIHRRGTELRKAIPRSMKRRYG